MSQLSDRDIDAIVELHKRWIEEELAGSGLQIIKFCTDDIRWIPPNSPPLAGKEAIAQYLNDNRVDLKDVQITDVLIDGADPVAYLTSNFSSRYITRHSFERSINRLEPTYGSFRKKPKSGEWLL